MLPLHITTWFVLLTWQQVSLFRETWQHSYVLGARHSLEHTKIHDLVIKSGYNSDNTRLEIIHLYIFVLNVRCFPVSRWYNTDISKLFECSFTKYFQLCNIQLYTYTSELCALYSLNHINKHSLNLIDCYLVKKKSNASMMLSILVHCTASIWRLRPLQRRAGLIIRYRIGTCNKHQ